MSQTILRDRCEGVLIGLAAGDRIGGPIRMAVRLSESLHACGGLCSADVLDRYLAWWREGAFDTGPVSDRVFAYLSAGLPNHEATAKVHREFGEMTAGCNPVHRSTPLSMHAAIPEGDLARCAQDEARLTHYDPIAGRIAAAANQLCRSLIRGVDWDRALQNINDVANRRCPLKNGGYAPDVLCAALHFVDNASCFGDALHQSILFAGPANYCPVLVGAIAGCRWGASSIPPKLLEHVIVLPRVKAIAARLASDWPGN